MGCVTATTSKFFDEHSISANMWKYFVVAPIPVVWSSELYHSKQKNTVFLVVQNILLPFRPCFIHSNDSLCLCERLYDAIFIQIFKINGKYSVQHISGLCEIK